MWKPKYSLKEALNTDEDFDRELLDVLDSFSGNKVLSIADETSDISREEIDEVAIDGSDEADPPASLPGNVILFSLVPGNNGVK